VYEPADWEALLQRSILPKLAQSLQTVSAARGDWLAGWLAGCLEAACCGKVHRGSGCSFVSCVACQKMSSSSAVMR
jgi:hypothetical protein